MIDLLADADEQERQSNAGKRRASVAYTWEAVCDAYLVHLAQAGVSDWDDDGVAGSVHQRAT